MLTRNEIARLKKLGHYVGNEEFETCINGLLAELIDTMNRFDKLAKVTGQLHKPGYHLYVNRIEDLRQAVKL